MFKFKATLVGLLITCIVGTVFSLGSVYLLTRNSGGAVKFLRENWQFIFWMFLYFVLRWEIRWDTSNKIKKSEAGLRKEIKKSEAGLRKEIKKTGEELDSILES